ncbi:MAG: hypothetical protein ACETWD_10120 [Desulfatiglandales bacterium]
MRRGVAFLALVVFSATIVIGCAHAVSPAKESITGTTTPPAEGATAEKMIADLLLLRPLGIVATVMGTAFFIVSLPFSVPGGNTKAAFQKLVTDPAKFTFDRPLGEVEDF